MFKRISRIKNASLILIMSGLLSNCASNSLAPQAQNVNIAVGPIPKGCILRGDVDGIKQDAPLADHRDVETSQSIVLKNQAAKLDANVIFVTTHKTVYYPQFIVSLGDWVPAVDTHTLDGKAYYCNTNGLNQIKHKGLSHVSEVETVTKNW